MKRMTHIEFVVDQMGFQNVLSRRVEKSHFTLDQVNCHLYAGARYFVSCGKISTKEFLRIGCFCYHSVIAASLLK